MRISDWSSDVCSSDLVVVEVAVVVRRDPLDLVPLDLIDTAEHLGFRLVGLRIAGGPLACVFAGRRARVLGLAAGRREVDLVRQQEIGSASCRERVCQYVSISVVAASLNKKQNYIYFQL